MPVTPRVPLRPKETPGIEPAAAAAALEAKWAGKAVAPDERRRPAWPNGEPPAPGMILKMNFDTLKKTFESFT